MINLFMVLIIGINFFSFMVESEKSKTTQVEQPDWEKYFAEANLEGTFVLSKLNSDTLEVYSSERAERDYLPASTFKILNSLISLETKVIKDEHEIIKWDGNERFYEKWNHDQNLRTAIKYSCVWFYQELARRVGNERMQYFLDTTNYGNSKIGTDIDKFWLEGDLRISAIGQIEFLTNFLNKDLPFSNKNFEIVKDILMVDSSKAYKLYAKTGWTARVDKDKQIGWYVGFVENDIGIWIFAMNIDIRENKDAESREAITRKILSEYGLLK